MANTRPPLLPVERALKTILSAMRPLGSEPVSIREVLGRVLTRDVVARRDVPPWDNSSVDGYAVRAADVVSGRTSLGRGPWTGPLGELLSDGAPGELLSDGAPERLPVE